MFLNSFGDSLETSPLEGNYIWMELSFRTFFCATLSFLFLISTKAPVTSCIAVTHRPGLILIQPSSAQLARNSQYFIIVAF